MNIEMPTPALILNLDVFNKNLDLMQAHCAASGLALRPHAKTHKCSRIAKAQLEHGAVGICTAKLGEAEALADAGLQDILVTSPQVTDNAFDRAIALAQRIDHLCLVVDHPDIVNRLNDKCAAAGQTLSVMVDLNVGTGRTGANVGKPSTQLALQVDQASHLRLRGFQAYAGHVMHIESFDERRAAAEQSANMIKQALADASAAGLDITIISGGGTGTYDIEPMLGVITELQAGSYCVMDREYLALYGPEGSAPDFAPALFVDVTVISANQNGYVTTDGGFKSFATDGPRPVIFDGAPEGAKYFFMGDEHGGIKLPDGTNGLPVGSRVAVTVPHCDPTVNLYDQIHVVQDGQLIDIWPIEARGKSQ